jgi:predicted alpha/beta-fold hydrolase
VQNLLAAIQKREAAGAAVNMRMCSGEANRLKQTYHSGKTDDLDFLIRQCLKEFPEREIHLVGYSIGGNIILKWLGENGAGARERVQKAVAVSVPYDLARSVELLDRGFNREVYARSLLGRLKKKMAAKQKAFPDAITYGRLKNCKTFRVFDGLVTAPLNGFRDADDYWIKSSCKPFLKHVQVPTLLIHADDDPFFPGPLIPRDEMKKSGFIKTLFVPCGGHVGFVSGPWPWQQQPWLEQSILDFLF